MSVDSRLIAAIMAEVSISRSTSMRANPLPDALDKVILKIMSKQDARNALYTTNIHHEPEVMTSDLANGE
jgi:hypothetical protein